MVETKERETSKNIPIKGRKFLVEKFEALQGNALIMRAFRILPSLGLGSLVGIDKIPDIEITDEEVIDFQKKCLRYCFEILPSGKTKIVNDEGNFAVMGLERDGATVFKLFIAVIGFNAEDFFDESQWSELEQSFQTMNPSAAKTSTNSSTHQ